MKRFYKLATALALLIISTQGFSQNIFNGTQKEALMHYWPAELNRIKKIYGDNAQFTAAFRSYYNNIFSSDQLAYNKLIVQNKLNEAQANAYISALAMKYDSLHAMFTMLANSQLAILAQYGKKQSVKQTETGCNPTDSNLSFQYGTLTGWNAYYAVNSSTSSKDNITGIVGGGCGSVTGAANDPNTNLSGRPTDYQVIIIDSGTDALAPSIALVPSGNGSHSVRLGDSTNPDQGVAILSQTFPVDSANSAFAYSYAVLLENPAGHTYTEQPFFSVILLDQNNDTISNLFIAADNAGKAGFDSVYYTANSDYVYYKNWTFEAVPLTKYIGQCVTARFMIADCALGGHFGYGYINSSVGPTGINEVEDKNSIKVYPVPVSKTLYINSTNTFKATSVRVYDMMGKELMRKDISFKTNTESLDVSTLANGTYLLILSDGKTTSQAKFTVMQ